MSLELLITAADPTPKVFIRGATLEFVMELPHTVAASFFTVAGAITSVTLESKLRLRDQAGDNGFIADPRPVFESNNTKVRFLAREQDDDDVWQVADTSEWPLGVAEFDLIITRVVSGVTKKYRSIPVRITIADGVS